MNKTLIIASDNVTIRTIKKIIADHFPQIEIIGIAKDLEAGYKLLKKVRHQVIKHRFMMMLLN